MNNNYNEESINALSTTHRRKKTPAHGLGFFFITSLTITYFHTGCSTIIGAKSFHGPVRDGKGWDRLAMVIRLDLYGQRSRERGPESGRSKVWGVAGIQQTANSCILIHNLTGL